MCVCSTSPSLSWLYPGVARVLLRPDFLPAFSLAATLHRYPSSSLVPTSSSSYFRRWCISQESAACAVPIRSRVFSFIPSVLSSAPTRIVASFVSLFRFDLFLQPLLAWLPIQGNTTCAPILTRFHRFIESCKRMFSEEIILWRWIKLRDKL